MTPRRSVLVTPPVASGPRAVMVLSAVLGLAAVLASCSGTAPADPPTDLSAEVVQYRRDAQRDVLQVKVTNSGTEPVHVDEVRLRTATFTAPVVAGKDSTIAPGVSADLTVPLGEASCERGAADGSRHVAVVVVAGQAVELPVEGEVLEQVRDDRCRVRAVADHVHLSVADGWEEVAPAGDEPALRGTVLATPRPDADRVHLVVEGATTLFTVAGSSTAELAADATDPVSLDVVLTVTRCDPHAVAEDKKGYLLPVRVAVGDAEPVLVEVAVPVPRRAPLQDLIDRTCRGAGG